MVASLTKHTFITVAAIVAAFLCGCNGTSPTDRAAENVTLSANPHVVLIVIDTLRADKVGCYGGPDGTSPELDALADRGVRFNRVVAPSNWTKPSWAGMLTARYPRSLGVEKELAECLPDDAVTVAESFKAAGYRTFGATANPNINSAFNYHQGFGTYHDSHVVWDWMKVTGDDQDVSTTNEKRLAPATELYASAIKWAAGQNGAPCYIQIAAMEMHEYHRGPHSLNRPEFQNLFAKLDSPEREYYQALRQSSYDVQQFLDKLYSLPGWEDVLVVITSDHGEGLSSHPDVERSAFHGGVLYDSNLHVPLIMHRPGAIPAGRVVDRTVRLLDLAPTILDIAGLPALDYVDGVSLAPLIEGVNSVEGLPSFFVSESYLRDLDKISVESDAWRYIENHDQADPKSRQSGQMNLEALQPVGAAQNGKATDQIGRLPEIAAALRDQLRAWEQAHPKSPPTECRSSITEDELDQLRSIGYLDVNNDPDTQNGTP